MHFHRIAWFLFLFVLPAVLLLTHDQSFKALAQEDPLEEEVDEDEDAVVEGEDVDPQAGLTEQDNPDEEEEEDFMQLQASPDAETTILFVKPSSPEELPAGELVKIIIGFTNHGESEFIVNYLEGSFRYPQEYSFHIQNFSLVEYQKVVEPGRQASFIYNFIPSESFSARPFGLVINVNYKDNDDKYYEDAVFNQTIQVVEAEEGLDGETFFLYIFLAAVAVLLLVAGQQFLATVGKGKLLPRSSPVEVGTASVKDVDFDWIPQQTLNDINKSPKGAKVSPRNRRTRRSHGVESD